MRLRLRGFLDWLRLHRKVVLFGAGLGVLAVMQATQMFYPNDKMLPFANVDNMAVGGQDRSEVIKQLDKAYDQQKIHVNLGDSQQSALSPSFSQIGTLASNNDRVENINYPWYLRVVPTSLFWASAVIDSGEPEIKKSTDKLDRYLNTTAKDSCSLEPKSASLKANGDSLKLVPAENGLRCEPSDLKAALAEVEPNLSIEKLAVNVAADEISPPVNNDTAEKLGERIGGNTSGGVVLVVNGESINISQADVLSWLDFAPGEAGELKVSVSPERSAGFLNKSVAPKVAVAPGVSYITTKDFLEIERKDGKSGRALSAAATLDNLRKVVIGESETASAVTVSVPPRIEYTRTYSATDKGLNALLTNFAKDNKGTFGVSYAELSGERRRAEYNADKRFVTASTYKLYVAYSTLLRVESGKFSWSEHVTGGRSLEACFNDMIIKSDNPCAEALLQKIGFREITDEAKKIGLKNTTFLEGDRPLTSASDLAVFLATLESGQMLKPSSRAKLLDAMKQNVYRQGIPAGANGQVADKVGFLDNYLHDAAVVYSPGGTYVLTIMTEDSSWAKIAELAREIEKLRSS